MLRQLLEPKVPSKGFVRSGPLNRAGCTVHQRLRLTVVLSGPDWSGLSGAGQRAGRRVKRQMERAAR